MASAQPPRKIIHSPPIDPQGQSLPRLHPCPVRVVVQTLTHLVPSEVHGDGTNPYFNRVLAMLNLICRRHWDGEHERGVYRWYTCGDDFRLEGRKCLFLVDYGKWEGDGGEIPVLGYEWMGEEFESKPELRQSQKVQSILKEIPFTPGTGSEPFHPRTTREPPREIVKIKLHKTMKLTDQQLRYMRSSQRDMIWLKRKVKPIFWTSFMDHIESRYGRGMKDELEKKLEDLAESGALDRPILPQMMDMNHPLSRIFARSASKHKMRFIRPKVPVERVFDRRGRMSYLG